MATLSDGAGIEKSLSETSPLLDPEMVHFPVALQTHTSGNNGQGLLAGQVVLWCWFVLTPFVLTREGSSWR